MVGKKKAKKITWRCFALLLSIMYNVILATNLELDKPVFVEYISRPFIGAVLCSFFHAHVCVIEGERDGTGQDFTGLSWNEVTQSDGGCKIPIYKHIPPFVLVLA